MGVQQEIAAEIEEWLKERRNRNLSLLARLSMVSYSSVRRAAQGESDQKPTVIIPMARVIMSQERFRTFIKSNYPTLSEAILDHKGETSDDLLGDFMESPDHVRLIILASSTTGTTEAEVIQMYGHKSKAFFTDLKDAGVLEKKGERWVYAKDFALASMPWARMMLSIFAQDCDRENDDIKNASSAFVGWENLNYKAVVKVALLMQKQRKELYDIVRDPANRGEFLVIFGLLHNVLKGQEGLK